MNSSNVDEVTGDFPKFSKLLVCAEKGDINSQHDLGLAYEEGALVKQNYFEAINWYKRAFDGGNIESAFRIGRIYHFGFLSSPEYEAAESWYQVARSGGHVLAAVNLGMMYAHGEGVDINYKVAADFFKEAVTEGSHDAQNNLGSMYLRGLGVDIDEKEAFRLFLLAAEQGNEKAQLSVGLMYRDGIGVSRDREHALNWLRMSSEQGDDGAQFHLGNMLMLDGQSPTDHAEGRVWLQTSAEQGNEFAMQAIALLDEKELNVDDWAGLLSVGPMVQTLDDDRRWLSITVEVFAWSGLSRVTFGGLMCEKAEYQYKTEEIADPSVLISRGFREIQTSRGILDDGSEGVELVPGDQVRIDWRVQEQEGHSLSGQWRLTYSALPDRKKWGYLGDLSDYFYGQDEGIKRTIMLAKLNIIENSEIDEELKTHYKNTIEIDPNQQISLA